MPSTATITTFYTFTANTKARATHANTNFSNFRGHNIPINADTATASDLTHDLGSSDHRWRSAYLQDIYLRSSTTTADVLIKGNTGVATGQYRVEIGASVASFEVNADGTLFKIGSTTKFEVDTDGIKTASNRTTNKAVSSGDTGVFSGNNTTYTDITNLTVDISLTGTRPVLVGLMPSPGAVSPAALLCSGATISIADIQLLIAATALGSAQFGATDHNTARQMPGFMFVDEAPAAGLQTYKMQYRVNTATASFEAIYCKIFAWEMRV